MKSPALAVAATMVALFGASISATPALAQGTPVSRAKLARHPRSALAFPHTAPKSNESALSEETLSGVVKQTCAASCHSERRKSGNLSLENFDVAKATTTPMVAEKMISKLRAGMMPPPGAKRPQGDTLTALATTLERLLDSFAVTHPEPGGRTFQRLNRAEYERAIHELLSLDVDAGSWLPLDTKSANFDNIADVQMPSATTLDAYLDAA
ncbi:MAG: DUF1587 domain-containing protein, partial [Gemmatimonadaceae bacterium]